MFNSKYSKLLTTLLVIAIIAVLGILIFVGINWYKASHCIQIVMKKIIEQI